jgi:hypothetical protein
LVKDGASAIRALGTAIDTSMNTALGTKKAGMVLLNTTSFSAVSSVSFPNSTFTSTYDSHLVNFNLVPSTAIDLNYRVRATGTDASGSNYDTYANFVTTVFNGGGNIYLGTSGRVIGGSLGDFIVGEIKLYDLALAKTTKVAANGNASGRFWWQSGSYHNLSTAYDSLSLIASTGTITGTMSVYGFNR